MAKSKQASLCSFGLTKWFVRLGENVPYIFRSDSVFFPYFVCLDFFFGQEQTIFVGVKPVFASVKSDPLNLSAMKNLHPSIMFPTNDSLVSFPYRFRIVSVSFPYRSPIVLLSFSYHSPIKLLSRSGNDTEMIPKRVENGWRMLGGTRVKFVVDVPCKLRFQLTKEEMNELVTNCDRFYSLKHSTARSYAFTEQGVAMLSAVLRSETAIRVSIRIMDAFVAMRHFMTTNAEGKEKELHLLCNSLRSGATRNRKLFPSD